MEGIDYPLQHSWASLEAQMVKNLPTMWKTWVWFLGWKDPPRRTWQPTPVFLPGESPWTEEPGGLQSMGSQRVGHNWVTKHRTDIQWRENVKFLWKYYGIINKFWPYDTSSCTNWKITDRAVLEPVRSSLLHWGGAPASELSSYNHFDSVWLTSFFE